MKKASKLATLSAFALLASSASATACLLNNAPQSNASMPPAAPLVFTQVDAKNILPGRGTGGWDRCGPLEVNINIDIPKTAFEAAKAKAARTGGDIHLPLAEDDKLTGKQQCLRVSWALAAEAGRYTTPGHVTASFKLTGAQAAQFKANAEKIKCLTFGNQRLTS